MSLRSLSMVLRQLPGGGSDEQGKRVLESVDMARQAVQLDVTDGTSWCEWGGAGRGSRMLEKQECVRAFFSMKEVSLIHPAEQREASIKSGILL